MKGYESGRYQTATIRGMVMAIEREHENRHGQPFQECQVGTCTALRQHEKDQDEREIRAELARCAAPRPVRWPALADHKDPLPGAIAMAVARRQRGTI